LAANCCFQYAAGEAKFAWRRHLASGCGGVFDREASARALSRAAQTPKGKPPLLIHIFRQFANVIEQQRRIVETGLSQRVGERLHGGIAPQANEIVV
jgi:hypothetical protein